MARVKKNGPSPSLAIEGGAARSFHGERWKVAQVAAATLVTRLGHKEAQEVQTESRAMFLGGWFSQFVPRSDG